jgi:hypothetical protein
MNPKSKIALSLSYLILGSGVWFVGCSQRGSSPSAASSEATPPKKHEHHPPHGGTPVVLGDEQFHLELVLEPSSGILRAYVLDGELENFIRITAPYLELRVVHEGRKEVLKLKAVADTATGETVGDTSLFEGKAEWLKQVKHFQAMVETIEVRGQSFKKVDFDFPEGNDKDEK